ncbi:type I restriction enzyme, S subunit [Xylanibacter ruminicola]|uniref:Type I restriction enzyme, S subunit n=1 Tax=Xylanibacter ruminicola TaxID=839 RepID=A0A1M7JZQ2_XYLRU|nr:restriction endonuclease subunit S [Xylanibacter ruminicola]SFC79005.1 type I restriction enzyme, S subunit [Xylanibacter ruminicola]SHM58496.1 type I restriction enzyme, S subunit [Xylanibacter ruminicola]
MSKVEWKKLVLVSDVLYGYPFESSLFSEDSSFMPLIRIRDVKPAKASTYYTGEFNETYRIRKGDILVGMDGEFNIGKWDDRDGLLNQRVLKLSGKDGLCLDGYLFHYMGPVFKRIEKETPGGSVKHLSAKAINNIVIPVPSMSHQMSIVEILDTFTSSIENLKEQIVLRRKQYEYYRDQLLDLEGKEGVEIKKLGEVCKIERGVRVVKKDLQEEGVIPVYQNSLIPLGYFEKSNYPENTTFVICAGAAGEIGYSKVDFWAADDCTCIVCPTSICSRYIYYHLMVKQHSLKTQVRKASVPRLSKDVIAKQHVFIPSLQEQQRIVSILDTFEESIQNLEAQLAQREKQYEYYRNKLLTFE